MEFILANLECNYELKWNNLYKKLSEIKVTFFRYYQNQSENLCVEIVEDPY